MKLDTRRSLSLLTQNVDEFTNLCKQGNICLHDASIFSLGKPVFLKIDYFYFMDMCGLLAYVRTTRMPGTQGSQKRELDPLELDLITVVIHRVSAWTQTSSLLQE